MENGRRSPVPNTKLFNLRDRLAQSQEDVADALNALGAARGEATAVAGNHISRWERGIVFPSPLYRQLLAEHFQVSVTDLGLTRQRAIHPDTEDEVGQTSHSTPPPTIDGLSTAHFREADERRMVGESWQQNASCFEFAAVVRATWPGTRVSSSSTDIAPTSWSKPAAVLGMPGGRSFQGAQTPIQVVPATEETDGLVRLDIGSWRDPDHASGRGLVVAACRSQGSMSYYALDARHATRLGGSCEAATLSIPDAYRFDDFTYAALWAMSNLDQGLQDDDTALTQARHRARHGTWARKSEFARDQVSDMAAVAQMWLGSDFCARHITNHLPRLTEVPVFWTREQRGEEASTWLLFTHKLDYLRTTTAPYAGSGTRPVRVFCIPETAVMTSSIAERLLLLLAVSLMEASGITVHVTADPAHGDVPGFVWNVSGTALIATWARAEQVWHTGITTQREVVGEFADRVGHAAATSVIAADQPLQRLERLAYYLGLDWRWLRGRATDLSIVGWGGLVRPRSRLLSVTGLDEACRYLAIAA